MQTLLSSQLRIALAYSECFVFSFLIFQQWDKGGKQLSLSCDRQETKLDTELRLPQIHRKFDFKTKASDLQSSH